VPGGVSSNGGGGFFGVDVLKEAAKKNERIKSSKFVFDFQFVHLNSSRG
jgi:hypothetical protein